MESFLQPDRGFKINKENLQKASIIFLFVLVIIVMVAFAEKVSNPILLGFAAIVGGYMALNIGANDVANNVGPAVGSKALTMTGAIIIAAICEISGSLIAGGEVVSTVSSGIISVEAIGDPEHFVTLMLAALISGAIWLNIATIIGAPVSTTHAIVGGVLGSGIAAGGFGVANWSALGEIVGSWVISPVMGGVIAAALLFFIKHTITYKKNKKSSAENIVPYLIAFMTWAFSLYLIKKGLKHIIVLDDMVAFGLSIVISIIVLFIVKPIIKRALEKLENKKEEINKLFTIPLIFAVALLSFAHGANDVANAIGPLTAINEALKISFEFGGKANVPFWIMLIGGLGISIGLALFGPRLIRTVGGEITELDQMRAYCIAMSAALTVLVASELGMPVSSTHIAIGAIFGVGFLREHLKRQYKEMESKILESRKGEDSEKVKEFLEQFRNASIRRKTAILKSLERKDSKKKAKVPQNINIPELKKKEAKRLKEAYQEELVKRSAINKIVAAWLITVPVSAVFSAICYFILSAVGF
ncbi:inorganic phosphate transporter [uncultured Helicobacter sp.]|uniref:inorganic phosphate transporter n=1 Tax=uncultured Helicobacter sp. TaxID=175537 RepID=UPI00262F27EB|nr:inorganic phosphate transporter [uncultured Helicobacter sp.]